MFKNFICKKFWGIFLASVIIVVSSISVIAGGGSGKYYDKIVNVTGGNLIFKDSGRHDTLGMGLSGYEGYPVTFTIPETLYVNGWDWGESGSEDFSNKKVSVGCIIKDAFAGSTCVKSVIAHGGISLIGNRAFSNCPNLESFEIKNKDTAIYSGAFLNCPKLVLICPPGSKAETYAKNNKIPYKNWSGGIVYNSAIEKVTEKVTEPTTETTTIVEYIYNDTEKEVIIPTDNLDSIENADDAEKAVNEVISGLTSEEKNSSNGADKAILFGEEAVLRAATLKTDSGEILINDASMSELSDKAAEAYKKVSGALSSVKKIRKSCKSARIVSSSGGKVSISKEKLSKDVDNVKVETPYAGLSFSANSVSKVSIENKGTNKVYVDFGNSGDEKIKISFPNMPEQGAYKAVVDENGNPVGGKYNPVTGELTTKINKSGVYSVIDNEKNFSDIKNKAAEVQEAIKLLASKGIISGTSQTEFSPDKSISRAEVTAIILRTLSKLDENADGGFSDVTKSNWFYGTAGSAKNAGIINGYEDNTFRGNVVIPKVQIVSVSARVLKNEMDYYDVSDVEKILGGYKDSSAIAQWAKSDVALATDANVVIKRTDGLFGGTDEMTRGDAAIILKRLFDKVW